MTMKVIIVRVSNPRTSWYKNRVLQEFVVEGCLGDMVCERSPYLRVARSAWGDGVPMNALIQKKDARVIVQA